jgi:hypothetical protein
MPYQIRDSGTLIKISFNGAQKRISKSSVSSIKVLAGLIKIQMGDCFNSIVLHVREVSVPVIDDAASLALAINNMLSNLPEGIR